MLNRNKAVALVLAMIIISACGGSGDDPIFNDLAIQGFYPCRGAAGDQITIIGSHFLPQGNGQTIVEFNGTPAQVVSIGDHQIVVTVPPGATNGKIRVSNPTTGAFSDEAFEVGGRITVPEVEPNDNTDGSNATPVGKGDTSSGALSSVLDRDHFVFDCLLAGEGYTVQVTPRLVTEVFVDGASVPLDANGKGRFFASSTGPTYIGLTGGTGSYTLHITFP